MSAHQAEQRVLELQRELAEVKAQVRVVTRVSRLCHQFRHHWQPY
jgi:CRISPR/Cas system Type II protein with McrA/HNH and RuvC-like nuclease domain